MDELVEALRVFTSIFFQQLGQRGEKVRPDIFGNVINAGLWRLRPLKEMNEGALAYKGKIGVPMVVDISELIAVSDEVIEPTSNTT